MAVALWMELHCAFCDGTPDNCPWCEYCANDPKRPMKMLCFQCGDTCLQRWPLLSLPEAVTKAGHDAKFKAQVLFLTQVKLGNAAKLFLPAEVAQEETIGIRVEEQLVPLDSESFKTAMNSKFGPEQYPELRSHPFKRADGKIETYYLHRDPMSVPKITMYREFKLTQSELKLASNDTLDNTHASDFMGMLTKHFMDERLPVNIPTMDETRMLVQQRGAPVGTSTVRGALALCDAGALTGGADGSQQATHGVGVTAFNLGGSSALLAQQLASRAGLAQSSSAPAQPKPKGAAKAGGPNNGGGSSRGDNLQDSKRRRKQEPVPEGSKPMDLVLPDVEVCLRGESGVQGSSVLQMLHRWKTQMDGRFTRREMPQKDHIDAMSDHRLRVFAFSLSSKACGSASTAELKKCLSSCMTAWTGALPHDVFVTVFRKAIDDVWRQPTSIDVRITYIALIGSPQPPEPRDGEIQALKDVPVSKLSQEDRWRVAHDLWLEAIIPKLMNCKTHESSALQAALASVLSLAGSGDAPGLGADTYRKALADTCGILACYRQDTPMVTDQARGLRSVFAPEGAPSHIQVLSQLIDSDWRAALKSTMGFSIHEAQSASDIAVMVEGLQGRSADVAWETLLKRWPNWREKLRPRTLQRIAEQAHANIETRVQELKKAGGTPQVAAVEGLALIHLCTEFAQMVLQPSKEEWMKLGMAAKEAHRNSTADLRLSNFVVTCQKVNDQPEEVSDLVWAAVVAEAEADCDHCKGMISREEDRSTIIAAIGRSFKANACSEASLSLASRLTHFIPEAVEPELRKMAAASLTASRLVALGGVPGPTALDGVPEPVAAQQPIAIIKKALEEWESAVKECPRSSEIVSWPVVEALVRSLTQDCALRAVSEAEAAKAAWQQALDHLAENVAHCDWKKGLPKGCDVWTQVVREMDYKFWKSSSSPLPLLDAAYDKVLTTKAHYDSICSSFDVAQDGDANKQHEKCKQAALMINTEEFLARMLLEGSSASLAKIGKRIDKIMTLFPYEELCPVIRKAVHGVTGL